MTNATTPVSTSRTRIKNRARRRAREPQVWYRTIGYENRHCPTEGRETQWTLEETISRYGVGRGSACDECGLVVI